MNLNLVLIGAGLLVVVLAMTGVLGLNDATSVAMLNGFVVGVIGVALANMVVSRKKK